MGYIVIILSGLAGCLCILYIWYDDNRIRIKDQEIIDRLLEWEHMKP